MKIYLFGLIIQAVIDNEQEAKYALYEWVWELNGTSSDRSL